MNMVPHPPRLREIINRNTLTPLANAYDALSAKLVERAGFEAVHVGGYNVAASLLGLPDVGYMTMSEMVMALRHIVDSVDIPVVADGDDGYGNHLNTGRLIRELERSRVAGVHIEDQVFPKRCGHMEGKRLIPSAAMVNKIKAALDARVDESFVLVARTDAIAVEGFAAALDRAGSYVEAGADVIFVEAPTTLEQCRVIPRSVSAPTLFNWAYGGKSPELSLDEITDCGFRLAIFPDTLFAVASALEDFYGSLKRTGTIAEYAQRSGMMNFGAFNALIGLDKVAALDRRFGDG
jgi:2-methylisocitrate lyase-like PEP mutase family enzyme